MIPIRAAISLFTRCPQANFRTTKPISRAFNSSSSNITYSGGHASEGQGGYYGSGGARHVKVDSSTAATGRTLVAMVEDVKTIGLIMKELEVLERLLERELEEAKGEVTGTTIEIRSNIKKLMTSNDVMECMGRLEHSGEPTWGLTESEIELVREARSKINEC
mmetsp:Transcript_10268/g.13345  ORF Transcript_10268/g.13345 Transcript_10268/m.13345 type:complete len:163 (+) Transcript_10268:75-563(+)